jgi:hypothetical protein
MTPALTRTRGRPGVYNFKLSPADNNAPYLAVYYSVGDFIFGASVLAAGWTCDRLEDRGFDLLNIYAGIILLGWLGRTLVAALLVPIDEPGACVIYWHTPCVVASDVRRRA